MLIKILFVFAAVWVLAEKELVFFSSSWYGEMLWICDENSVDNTGMF